MKEITKYLQKCQSLIKAMSCSYLWVHLQAPHLRPLVSIIEYNDINTSIFLCILFILSCIYIFLYILYCCITARKDLNTWANSAQVQQVIEMGFSRHAVYAAIQALGKKKIVPLL